MKKKLEQLDFCPLQGALQVIGGKWKLVILWHLEHHKKLGFNALRNTISTISTKVLSEQLVQLQEAGLIRRDVQPTNPPQVHYSLTKTGHTLNPIIKQLYEWGEKFSNYQSS